MAHPAAVVAPDQGFLAPGGARTRKLLCVENFLLAFSVGTFLVLPLALQSCGLDEVFFGKVFAAGAVGALACAGTSSWLLHRFGLSAMAPWGSGTFCAGSVVLTVSLSQHGADWGWYVGSVLQGMGWGFFLAQGPICLSTVVVAQRRARHFMIYGAFNTLGVGMAPLLCGWVLGRGWTFVDVFIVGSVASGAACLASAWAARRNSAYVLAGAAPGAANRRPVYSVLGQRSVWFVVMVFLCACVYTSVMNFQTTLAAAWHIDYTVFYGAYMLAVVAARLGLGGPLSKLAPSTSVPAFAALMAVGLVLLCLARTSAIAYALGALALGIGYGLLYPTIQAQAAGEAPAELRAQTLIAFSLSYLFARYLFLMWALRSLRSPDTTRCWSVWWAWRS